MVFNKSISFITALFISMGAHAGQIDGGAVLGSVIGAAAGSAVGSAAGGTNGAIIGGGVGGALGAAVGSDQRSSYSSNRVTTRNVIVVDGHNNGMHGGPHMHRHRKGHGNY